MSDSKPITQEQWDALIPFRELWSQIGNSTEPADRTTAESAIAKLYQLDHYDPPKFVWCSSPLTANILINLSNGDAIEELFQSITQIAKSRLKLQFPSLENSKRTIGSILKELESEIGKSKKIFKKYPEFSLKSLAQSLLSSNLLEEQIASVHQAISEPYSLQPPNPSAEISDIALNWVNKHIKERPTLETAPNFWGQQDTYWVAFYKFCEGTLGVKYDGESSERLELHAQITKSCMWIWSYRKICILCERPKSISIHNNRPHNEQGPALSFRDGWNIYAINGIPVPYWFIEKPHRITVETIENEKNIELRRIMINRYGRAKYIQDCGAEVIHRDEWGTLYRKELPGDEPLMMVKVVNCTPEPDGTFEDYFLRVNPELRPILPDKTLGDPQELTARNAVASTFGKTGKEYNPDVET